MAIQFSLDMYIIRPVEMVFEYITDVENDEEWHPSVVESTQVDEEMAVGST